MLAPLPATIHVPDETAAPPITPVLPTSRVAQPDGSADCARTTLALTASAHTNPTADRAPPQICLVVKTPLPVICRALVHSARHVSAGRTDVSPSTLHNSNLSARRQTLLARALPSGQIREKFNIYRSSIQSSSIWKWAGTGPDTSNNYTNRGVGSGNNYDIMSSRYPSRIVCLTEETTETLYLLGEGDRIVGISGYTVRPPEARHKPKVSAFINARFDKIEALEPDLILAFSDLQADIAAELIRRGYSVVTFNQRSIAEILQMIRMVGAIVGCADRAVALADSLEHGLENIRTKAAAFGRRPRVFFEEWDAPLISGICWVDELVEIAGGEPLFPALRKESLAKNRIVSPDEVAARDPEVIIASWCGKAMKKRTIVERPGWDRVSAVRADHVYEIKSTYILQPGPAALTEGVTRMHECLARAARGC